MSDTDTRHGTSVPWEPRGATGSSNTRRIDPRREGSSTPPCCRRAVRRHPTAVAFRGQGIHGQYRCILDMASCAILYPWRSEERRVGKDSRYMTMRERQEDRRERREGQEMTH